MTTKINYQGTLVCSINVSDLDRSTVWYRDGLGFEEIYRWLNTAGVRCAHPSTV